MLYEKMLDNFNTQLQDWSEPFSRAHSLTLEAFEKIAQFQIDRATEYTDLSIGHLREATQVSDPDSLQTYLNKQVELANTVSQNVNDDINNLTQLSGEYFDELNKLANENLTKIQEMASNFQFPNVH